MDDLDILRDLIKGEALADIESPYEKDVVVLREDGNGPQDAYTVKLHNVPVNAIVIKADMFSPSKNIFKDSKGECKRADYVMIVNTPQKNWIICIEMKKRKLGDSSEIKKQLKGAKCFVAYCRAIGRSFWDNKGFLDENNYQYLFVSIMGIGIDIKPTRRKKSPDRLHDTPENMLKIPAPGKGGLQFNRLIANGKRKS